MTIQVTDQGDIELGEHIQRTLFAVAETIEPAQAVLSTEHRSPRRRSYRRGLAIVAAVFVAALAFVGWKTLGQGDVERIPVEAALESGTDEGFEWWLIPSEAISGHSNPCGVPFPGVEMVSAATNRPGEQWDTGGVNYGAYQPNGTEGSGVFTYDCTNPQSSFDGAAWLADPTLHDVGFTRLGRDNDSRSPWGASRATSAPSPSTTAPTP